MSTVGEVGRCGSDPKPLQLCLAHVLCYIVEIVDVVCLNWLCCFATLKGSWFQLLFWVRRSGWTYLLLKLHRLYLNSLLKVVSKFNELLAPSDLLTTLKRSFSFQVSLFDSASMTDILQNSHLDLCFGSFDKTANFD